MVGNLLARVRDTGLIPGLGRSTHSSVLAWRIPGTGEPGGLPSMVSHRVRHDWSDFAAAVAAEKIPHTVEQLSLGATTREATTTYWNYRVALNSFTTRESLNTAMKNQHSNEESISTAKKINKIIIIFKKNLIIEDLSQDIYLFYFYFIYILFLR